MSPLFRKKPKQEQKPQLETAKENFVEARKYSGNLLSSKPHPQAMDLFLLYIDRCLQLDPTYLDAYHLKASMFRVFNQGSLAVEVYKQASKHLPDDVEIIRMIIKNLMETGGSLDEAFDWIDRALKLEPKNDKILSLKSAGLFNKGLTEEALRIIDLALETEPDYHSYVSMKGYFLFKLERWQEAKSAYEKLLLLLDSGKSSIPRYKESKKEALNYLKAIEKEIEKESS